MNYRNTVTVQYEGRTYKAIFQGNEQGKAILTVSFWSEFWGVWLECATKGEFIAVKALAYRKMAKVYRGRYANLFDLENVNEIKRPSILDKQAPKHPHINYYLGMWAFMNSMQVALETTIERLLRELQHENRYPSNRHSEFKALESVAVGMLCQVQVYGGCQPYKLRKGFKLHFNDRGWNQHLDNPWIKRATRFMRSKLGKQIMTMST